VRCIHNTEQDVECEYVIVMPMVTENIHNERFRAEVEVEYGCAVGIITAKDGRIKNIKVDTIAAAMMNIQESILITAEKHNVPPDAVRFIINISSLYSAVAEVKNNLRSFLKLKDILNSVHGIDLCGGSTVVDLIISLLAGKNKSKFGFYQSEYQAIEGAWHSLQPNSGDE
jgi:hypothetical protein